MVLCILEHPKTTVHFSRVFMFLLTPRKHTPLPSSHLTPGSFHLITVNSPIAKFTYCKSNQLTVSFFLVHKLRGQGGPWQLVHLIYLKSLHVVHLQDMPAKLDVFGVATAMGMKTNLFPSDHIVCSRRSLGNFSRTFFACLVYGLRKRDSAYRITQVKC